MNAEIEAKVTSIIAALRKLPPAEVRLDATLEQLGIDSLDKINLLFELESAFDIEIPDEEARSISTVGDIVRKLEAMGAKLASPPDASAGGAA